MRIIIGDAHCLFVSIRLGHSCWRHVLGIRTTAMTPVCAAVSIIHDDVIKWKYFPRYWPFVRGIHWSLVNSPQKASDAEHRSFLWSAPEQTVEKTIKTPVIWDAIAFIMTSLSCSLWYLMNKACRTSAITRTTILVPDHFIEIIKTFEIRKPEYEIDWSGNE